MTDGELVAAALRTARARRGWTVHEAASRLGWLPERLGWLEEGFGALDPGEERALIVLYEFEPHIARAIERLVPQRELTSASRSQQIS